MEKYEDNIMSVKKALDKFFIKFLDKYQETSEGLPRELRRRDIDQSIYAAGTCPQRSEHETSHRKKISL